MSQRENTVDVMVSTCMKYLPSSMGQQSRLCRNKGIAAGDRVSEISTVGVVVLVGVFQRENHICAILKGKEGPSC